MSLHSYSNKELNFFKFASIVLNEFPKALRHVFVDMWDKRIASIPGYQPWDDSTAVRNILLKREGPKTKIPTSSSFQDWDCTTLFQATLYARTFALPDSKGNIKTLGELYLKNRNPIPGPFHSPVASSSGNPHETIALAIDQLRLLRNTLCHSSNPHITKITFDDYVKHAKEAFTAVNLSTTSIEAIGNLAESDFPTAQVQQLHERRKHEEKINLELTSRMMGVEESIVRLEERFEEARGNPNSPRGPEVDQYELTLKINGRHVVAGTAMALAAYYLNTPGNKGKVVALFCGALEGMGKMIRSITSGSLVVVLHCYSQESFLQFLDDYQSGSIKKRLSGELSRIGIEEVTVEIVNKEDVIKQREMIRDEMSKESESSEKEALGQASRDRENPENRLSEELSRIGIEDVTDETDTNKEEVRKQREVIRDEMSKESESSEKEALGQACRGPEGGDKRQEKTYLLQGNAYLNIGEYQTAIEYYQKAQNMALERGDKEEEGQAYLRLGHTYLIIGQYQTAIEYYQKAENTALESGDKRHEGQAYLGLGDAYQNIGQYQTAIEYYQKAQNIALERENKWQEGQAYLGLGYVYLNIGQYQTAIENYQKAENVALEREDKRQEGQAYLGLGNAYRNIDQYQTAIEYYQKAENIALEHGDKRQEGQAYLGLGNAYRNIGQYQTAIEYYQKAENIALERGDKQQERGAYRALGNAYLKIGQYQTTIEYYQKAQNIALERRDKRQEGEAFLNLRYPFFK